MPVLFSRACEHALRGLIEMAREPDRRFWSVNELARRCDAPAPFLAKTFQSLVKARVLRSSRGRRGGFSFARSADDISLLDIINIIDGPTLSKSCALGLSTCCDGDPCPFHSHWGGIRASLMEALSNETIAQLAQGLD
jgi:Rrf2 family protein